MTESAKITVAPSSDPAAVPRRIATVPQKVPVRFADEHPTEDLVMSFPHLVIRLMIAFMGAVIVMAILAIFFNAPLEELANAQHTPNPAKAPWYFLGLQELLHYFPPVVAGILIPILVVTALVVIPYFGVNIRRKGMWEGSSARTFWILVISVATITAVTARFGAFDIVVPTLIVFCIAVVPYFSHRSDGWIGWLRRRSLAEWIMTWFVVVATVLTLAGVFFRGPGWSVVLPWAHAGPG
jgi:menaquinol-cytochrome c reductase cytochrome b/c subunit